MNEVKHDAFLAPSMKPSGSFVEPLAYSITSAKPTGLAINPTTGQFSSAPGVFGDWPITIRVTDAEQTAAEAVIQVKSTLNGHIIASPGNIDKKYRTGETFETPTQSFSNIMSNVELTLSGSTRPVDLNFSYTTGKFNGLLSTPGQYNYNLSAKDSGNRTLEKPVEFRFEIVPPLTIKTPQSIVAKQYSKTSDIKVEAPEVENSMGKITFQLLGEVPGTLITRQNNNGTISYYSHIDGLARPISLENFPLDAIVFDTNTGSLTGIPSKIGQYPIAITAVDDHRDDYLNMDDATRVSHNTAVSSIITINVGSPDALTLVASENPHHIERPYDDASAIVTAAGFAYGVAPTLTIENPSALPPGVTYTTAAHQLLFTGTSDTRGSYKGVNVKVTDVAGRSHSMPMEFWVYSTSDPIILNVSDIYTKPGYTFTTSLPWTAEEVTTDRTFGEIAFFSDELENLPQVLLNPETGAISGKFDETGLHRFNLNVGDETPRLTSEPVIINVIPFLRIIAPNVVPLDVDGYNDEVVATDYNIGKVKFRKGAGIWPVGISVDEDTGSIKGVPQGGIATYPGLTIIGVDEIGDEQASNVFSISVEALGPYVQLLSGPLETAVKRQAYNFDLTENLMILQEIPNNELTWSITAVGQDQNLPSGLSIVNGALTGTPSFGGNFQFTITATWSKQPAITAKQVYRLQVDLPELAINFDETTLDEADTAMIYNFDLSTLISTTNLPKDQVTFQIHADKPGQRLPTGLDLEGKNLTGFATEGGTFNFTILARFANAQELSEKEADVSLTVIDLGADVSWRKIATANLKSCGISLDYDLYCWGLDNSSGSSIAVNVPTKVELLDGVKVKDISFTNTKSCVITLDGGVKCWGGTTTDGAGFGATVALRDVPGFTSGVEKISVGFNHQCLLKEERAYCWGVGTSGQLGHGSAQSKTTPNMVMWGTGMPLITQDISASQNSAYTCAVKKDTSQVLCFGAPGSYTRLGKAGTANVSWPTPVNDTALYQSVETGVDTACGILTSGQLKCWGRNQSGVLGIATTTASVNGPRAIAALANVKAVTIGGDWLCAINSNDGTQCLGQALRIGTGAAASGAVTTPQSVGIGSPVIGVSGNTTHTCAVTSYGEGFCWGLNSWGQVGSGTVGANETSPRPVDSP
jgi:alpha-tubulin suppressor-like RCC1 family protein